MDKITYFKRSKELGLPSRCPMVGYCERWVWSIFYNTYHTEKLQNKETVFDFLKRKNELPSDFEKNKIKLCGEPITSQRSIEVACGFNFCPEIALFSDHRPMLLPKEAISSFSWFKQEGLMSVEHTHFSECLEFIQTKYFSQSEITQGKKPHSEIRPDGLETAKQELIEFRNHVENYVWKDILIKDKPQENIARAILQTFLERRSYHEVPMRGGKTDLISIWREGIVLYETKIWRGKEYHAQGLREIEEYVKGEQESSELLAVFYVVFDATKTYCSKSYIGESFAVEKAGNHYVYTITICLSPPQPSKIKPNRS